MNASEDRPPLHRLAGLVLGLALLPGIVGVATEYWLRNEDNEMSDDDVFTSLGLWRICGKTACRRLMEDDVPDWFNAVRGLCVMGLCLHVISVVTGSCCSFLGASDMNQFSFLPRLEEACAVLAGILMAGGAAVFVRSTHAHPVFGLYHLGWSFWLCLAHVCLLLLCGGVISLARNHNPCLFRRRSRNVTIREKLRPRDTSFHRTLHTPNAVNPPTKSFSQQCEATSKGLLAKSFSQQSEATNYSLLAKWKETHPGHYFGSFEGLPKELHGSLGPSLLTGCKSEL